MIKKLLLLLFAIFIYGCGGGNDGDVPKPIVDEIKAPIAKLKVSQVDLSEQKNMKISLMKSVIDPQDLPISLISVESLTEGCDDPVFDRNNLTFDVKKNNQNYCAYQYTVKNNSSDIKNDKKASSISYVVMSETGKNLILDPLSASVTVGELLSLNLKDKLGAIFTENVSLQGDAYILGSGDLEIDSVNSVIKYKPEATGVSRLMYSIHHDDTNETMIGYIDVAVSSMGNTVPEADDFLGPENVALNTEIEIDVAAHIRDDDGDILQLTDVYVYNDEANVEVSSIFDFFNTKFKFSASKAGVYDITYVIYDHRDGYAIGIVRVKVEGPAIPWHDITLLENGERYTAPLDKNTADLYHVYYQSLENYNLDGVDYEIPMFNYRSAETLCLSRGMVLPTKEQLIKLSDSSEDLVVNELGKWPTIDKFWTSSDGLMLGNHLAFDFNDKLISNEEDALPYIVTCVAPGLLSVEVTRNNSCTTTTIDSNACYDEVTATVLKNHIPVENEAIYLYSKDESLFLNKTQGYTDTNGQVVFQVRSKEPGEHKIYVSYYSQRLEELLNFILDEITTFEVTPSKAIINVGSVLELSARITKISGEEEVVTAKTDWQIIAGSESISLTENRVTGLDAGSALVIGKYVDDIEGRTFQEISEIKVIDPLLYLTLEPAAKTIKVDELFTYKVIAHYQSGATKIVDNGDVNWGKNNDHIFLNNGVVKGLTVGETSVIATYEGKSIVDTVTVEADVDSLQYLTLEPAAKTIKVEELFTYKVIAHYQSGATKIVDNGDVNWGKNNDHIFLNNGVVKGLTVGETSVIATYEGKSVIGAVTVESDVVVDPILSVSLDPESKTINVNGTVTMTLEARYQSGKTEMIESSKVTWTSESPSIAVIDSNGIVTGKAAGITKVSGSFAGKDDSSDITVNVDAKSLEITGPDTVLLTPWADEDSIKLESIFNSSTNVTDDSVWSSSNSSLASVDNYGRVVAHKNGKVVITAKYAGLTAQHTVTVDGMQPLNHVRQIESCETVAQFADIYAPTVVFDPEVGTRHSPHTSNNYTCKKSSGGLFPTITKAIMKNMDKGHRFFEQYALLTYFTIDNDSKHLMERIYADGVDYSWGVGPDMTNGKERFVGLKCIGVGEAHLTSILGNKKLSIKCI
ncbi:TPA: Ig-like domain-containing protein [Photobacterium damselae]